MKNMQIAFALLSFISGSFLAFKSGIAGVWWAIPAFLLCGLMVASWFIFGFIQSLKSWIWEFLSGVMMICFVFAVIFHHPGLDTSVQKAHSELFVLFQDIRSQCRSPNLITDDLQLHGMQTCGQASTYGLMDAATELWKAIYFGPGASLLDGANSLANGSNKDRCFEKYVEAKKICPVAFSTLNQETLSTPARMGVTAP